MAPAEQRAVPAVVSSSVVRWNGAGAKAYPIIVVIDTRAVRKRSGKGAEEQGKKEKKE